MGYRSEVKSVIYADKNKIDSFINDNKEAFDYLKSEFDDALQVIDKDNEKIIFLNGDAWKWYPTFKEIQAWDNFIIISFNGFMVFLFPFWITYYIGIC